MEKWKKVEDSEESRIFLSIERGNNTVSDICDDTGIKQYKVSRIISNIEYDGLINKNTNYTGDARKKIIELDKKRVKIKKLTMEIVYKLLMIIIPSIFSFIFSLIIENPFFFYGTIFGLFPIFLYFFYITVTNEETINIYKRID